MGFLSPSPKWSPIPSVNYKYSEQWMICNSGLADGGIGIARRLQSKDFQSGVHRLK
jgi:hypothetical protein